ncbi:MAG: O-antigen ligase family protein [Planctomycetota bacterium]
MLGTVAAGLVGVCGGLVVGWWAGRRRWVVCGRTADAGSPQNPSASAGFGVVGLALGLGLMGAVVLVGLTWSKGSALAAGLGVAVVVGALGVRWVAARLKPRSLDWVVRGVVGLVLMGVVGVMGLVWVRVWVWGVPLPVEEGGPGVAGERSLLFRWQYWGAAWRVWADGAWLWGVGPGGFQAAYQAAKDVLNPEDVQSAHNVWIDYAVMLGVMGLAWGVVLAGWLITGVWGALRGVGRGVVGEDEVVEGRSTVGHRGLSGKTGWCVGGGVGVLVFGVVYGVRLPGLTLETAVLALVGAGALAGLMKVLGGGGVEDRWVRVGLAAGALAAVGQGQMDMGFFQGPSAGVVWFVVGLCGGSGWKGGDADAWGPGVPPLGFRGWGLGCGGGVVLVGVGLVLMVGVAGPMSARERVLDSAAVALVRSTAGGAGGVEAERAWEEALAGLDAAGERYPGDEKVRRWRVRLRLERAAGAERFLDERPGMNDVFAGRVREQIGVWRQEALGIAEAGVQRRGTIGGWRGLAEASWAMGDRAGAMVALREAVRLGPYDLSSWRRLAEALEVVGDEAGARAAWERVLWIDAKSYLDPAKQLGEAERARVLERVGSR